MAFISDCFRFAHRPMLSRIFKLQTLSLGNAIARSFSRIPSSVDVNQDMDSKEKIAEKAVLYIFIAFFMSCLSDLIFNTTNYL